MANKSPLIMLSRGVKVWNKWREKILTKIEVEESESRVMIDLSGADLNSLNLHGINLLDVNLTGAKLCNAILTEADLSRAGLNNADLRATILSGADLRQADLTEAKLFDADLRKANLTQTTLRYADLSRANLQEANLREADLVGADFYFANLQGVNLKDADLTFANLVGANLEGAILTNCKIYGISAWGVKLDKTEQSNLVITPLGESKITVDNLEVAQFIYLLLHSQKIRHVIDTITAKVVLILGRFTPERKTILDAIREELRRRNYLPVLFDFDPPESRDTHETITTLARLARFIIADITDPKSIPQELISIVESLPSLPVQPLLEEGHEPWGMYDHIKRYPWVLEICHYQSLEKLLSCFEKQVISPAESKALELLKRK